MKKTLSILMAAALVLPGCLSVSFEEEKAVLETPTELVEGLSVDADTYLGDPVLDTLVFMANRTWSAKVVPADCDWITLGVTENPILSHVSEEVRIPVAIADNEGSARQASIVISTGDNEITVPVKQGAKIPRLGLLSDSMVSGISSDPDSVVIKINSNVNWTAEVDAASTAAVTLSETSGSKHAELKVYFPENESAEEGKTATIILKAEGCDPVTVTLVQNIGTPYIRMKETELEIPAGKFDSTTPFSQKLTLAVPFKTNQDWKASVNGEAFADLELSAMSGTKSTGITLSCPLNSNPVLDKEAEITIETVPSAEGIEKVTKTFKVIQKGKLLFYFSTGATKFVPGDSQQIMDGFSALKSSNSQATHVAEVWKTTTKATYTGEVYEVIVFGKQGVWKNSQSGLQLKNDVGDYVQFPAIAGYRVAQVEMKHGSTTGVKYLVADETGNPADGGAEVTLNKVGAEQIWNLSMTKAGQPMRLVKNSANAAAFDQIEVRYEKVTE